MCKTRNIRQKLSFRKHRRIVKGRGVGVKNHNRKIKYAPKRRPFSSMSKSTYHLPIETAVYVPSTTGKNKKISEREFENRTDETEKWYSKHFGGSTKVDSIGSFQSTEGKTKGSIIKEDVNKVTSFSSEKDYKKKEEEFKKHIQDKKKDWDQESIGVEFEGDLFYI